MYSPTLEGSRSACMLAFDGRYRAKIDEIKEEVLPLPFVPAIWIGFSLSKSVGCE